MKHRNGNYFEVFMRNDTVRLEAEQLSFLRHLLCITNEMQT
jgi:hypothetical protein